MDKLNDAAEATAQWCKGFTSLHHAQGTQVPMLGEYPMGSYGFLMRHGRPMAAGGATAEFPRMKAKECYYNCWTLVSDNPRRLRYCEGLVLPAMPEGGYLGPLIAHAWCWDMAHDRMIDPTLEYADIASYVGVRFGPIMFRTMSVRTETGGSWLSEQWHNETGLYHESGVTFESLDV